MNQQTGARVLVVDDEPGIRRAIQMNLNRQGYRVLLAATGREAIEQVSLGYPDLIILDLGLPDIDGLEVIREVRARGSTPIIILSVRGSERDKIGALDLGADDYLTKPFGVGELLARVRVSLRRSAGPAQGATAIFRAGSLEVDLDRRLVRVDSKEVHLTPTEYGLLKAFIAHPDRILTDQMLLGAVWGPEYRDEAHYLHVYVARLRKKLEPDPQKPRFFLTEPGVGYRLVADEQ
jgi:two-component system KDP operon response regulator KdpE